MRKTKICEICKKEFYVNQKINGKWLRFIKRKCCLDCSPLYSNQSRTMSKLERTQGVGKYKFCPGCAKVLSIEEFSNNNKDGYKTTMCISCSSNKVRTSKRRFKQECINFLGGSCSRCGYRKCQDALEFHHKNPIEKDFQISRHSGTILNDTVKKELEKCILVCSNCHRELHNEIYEQRLLNSISKNTV